MTKGLLCTPGESRKVQPAAQLRSAAVYCPDPQQDTSLNLCQEVWHQLVQRNSRIASLSSSESTSILRTKVDFSISQKRLYFHHLLGLKLHCKHNFTYNLSPPHSKYISSLKLQAPELRLCNNGQKGKISSSVHTATQAGTRKRILYWTLSGQLSKL